MGIQAAGIKVEPGVLVFAYRLVGQNPRAKNSQYEKSDYNVKGHPIHNLSFRGRKNSALPKYFYMYKQKMFKCLLP
jgi:hypothetical protein